MKKSTISCLIFVFGLLFLKSVEIQAQKGTSIQILNSEELESGVVNGKPVRILRKNVQLQHDNVLMFCDSAFLNQTDNSLNAYSNVHIKQGDSLDLYSNNLEYDGNTKKGNMTGNVKLDNRQATLTTSKLYFDRVLNTSYYLDKGIMISEDNKLTSQKGYYYPNTKEVFFRGDVRLVSPNNVMTTDTLRYNTSTKVSYFLGPTFIISKTDSIYCESGYYQTKSGLAQFTKKAYMISGVQKLSADTIDYDKKLQKGIGKRNVRIRDKKEKTTLIGDYGIYYTQKKTSSISGNVLVSKELDNDTMNVAGDTLSSEYDSITNIRILKSYKNVRIYSRQFQGSCDTLIYSTKDSIIRMLQHPIFWFDAYQGTADTILIHTKNNKISFSEQIIKSFLLSPEDSLNYNQIKGKTMIGKFMEGKLETLDVSGNAESVYFIKDDAKKYMGANKIASGKIRISMKEGKLYKINFGNEPVGQMKSLDKTSPKELKLEGFNPMFTKRPKSVDDLRKVNKVINSESKPFKKNNTKLKKNESKNKIIKKRG